MKKYTLILEIYSFGYLHLKKIMQQVILTRSIEFCDQLDLRHLHLLLRKHVSFFDLAV